MRITVRIFFRSIHIRNKDVIPEKGPLLVLANHPSTFMDPIVVAAILNRKVFFLAKGQLFKTGFSKWILPKFNIIPVYRKQDDPSQMVKNEETFVKCYEHLERNGAILMFPEGISITERKLHAIKTGASRIVLGAEARNDFKLGVHIVNIGLNYENPHRFNRDLFINIHKPIKVSDYKNAYLKDSFDGAKTLTLDITRQLEKLIIAIVDDKTDTLVKDIETLYKSHLSKERSLANNEKDAEFIITKNILETVNYFTEHDPIMVENIHQRIKSYFKNLNDLGIDDTALAPKQNRHSAIGNSLKSLAIILLGLPIWLFGWMNNFLAFEIPAFLARKASDEIEWRGAIGMIGGMITFPLFYSLQIITFYKLTNHEILTAIYGFSLPLSGLFAYWYYYRINEIRTNFMLLVLFYKKSIFISSLITEREQLITEFNKIKDRYLKIISDNRKPFP